MRPTGLFFAYLFFCLALAALLTPPLMATGWIDQEPQRVMGRLAQVLILLGFWPFLRLLGLNDRHTLGYGIGRAAFGRAVVRGWLLGVVILAALVLALLALGARVPDPSPPALARLLEKAALALVGGLLIGVLEETFFRGALHSAIRRRQGLAATAGWSALLYAAVHFMKPGALPDGVAFDANGALRMFGGAFVDLFQWQNLDALAALFMVGVLLTLVRERTGHVGWCIGLHAGWVFVIQVARQLTDDDQNAPLAFLAGDHDGVTGWLAAAWILGLASLYLASGRLASRDWRRIWRWSRYRNWRATRS